MGAKFKNTFSFLKTISFTVINVIRCQLKSLKYLQRKQLKHVIIHCSIAQIFKANGIYDYCHKLKRKQKSYKMYKYKKSEIFYEVS